MPIDRKAIREADLVLPRGKFPTEDPLEGDPAVDGPRFATWGRAGPAYDSA